MARFLVTGGTGFIGRHLLAELLERGDEVNVLVRRASRSKLEERWGDRVRPVEGDITKPHLGLSAADRRQLHGAEVFHLAAVYDLEASEEANERANVDGTRNAVDLANEIGAARIHHVSSIAVAGGSFKGEFTEEMFDEGQGLEHPYYKTKHEAEKTVREQARVPVRIYRPGIVVGSSKSGEADRVEKPVGKDLLGSQHGGCVGEAPGVGVEHRHNREDAVGLLETDTAADGNPERVQH